MNTIILFLITILIISCGPNPKSKSYYPTTPNGTVNPISPENPGQTTDPQTPDQTIVDSPTGNNSENQIVDPYKYFYIKISGNEKTTIKFSKKYKIKLPSKIYSNNIFGNFIIFRTTSGYCQYFYNNGVYEIGPNCNRLDNIDNLLILDLFNNQIIEFILGVSSV